MSESRLEALLRLNAVDGISTAASLALWEILGELLTNASEADFAAAGGLTLDEARRVRSEALAFDADAELSLAVKAGVRLLAYDDPGYPQLLKQTFDPPLVLYVQGGDLEADLTLAIVGSRRPTPYGVRMSRSLAKEAAQSGAVVVSGLARGIDAAAHEAALAARATTWAVLGSGLGRVYPAEHRGLAERIKASGGAVISEWPMQAPPLKGHFPRRNRIVSGLCWGTIVVEGTEHSGSLITARLALEQGREVFAVPGPADSPLSEAPHILLISGAYLVRRMSDVWEKLPPGARPDVSLYDPGAAKAPRGPSLSLDHQKILQLLGPDARTLDELGLASGIDLSRLSNIIFEMELRDLVAPVPGQRYAKKGS
ncbi:MAG: DNA-protecting protein DprA [Elusimicrobia bacterium]|nr:DNA-protecting protein DprA [Elusimicrobiota bacterium]